MGFIPSGIEIVGEIPQNGRVRVKLTGVVALDQGQYTGEKNASEEITISRDEAEQMLDDLDGILNETVEKSVYRVAVDCESCTIGPHLVYITVVAEDMHDALDKATEHSNASELWDEETQRSIANGEISDSRIERNYDGWIEEIDYVGDME